MAIVSYDSNGPVLSNDSGPLNKTMSTHSVASDYLGYGSYSGADIKVIVHYPRNTQLESSITKEKADLTYSLYQQDKLINEYNQSGQAATSPIFAQSLIDTRNGIEYEIEKLDSYLSDIKSMPTSKVLAELQTISWSIFREKSPVRTLGSVYPRAYVRGPRTIGGTMIFTVFHNHVLHEILDLNLGAYNTGTSDHDKFRYTTNLPDQLPPLDISLIFANEYGAISHMGLWGVEFLQEGATFSVEDIFSENTVQYVARDIDPMREVDARKLDGQGVTNEWSMTASDLVTQKKTINGHLTRRNPFL